MGAFGLLFIFGVFLIQILNNEIGKFYNLLIDWAKNLVRIWGLNFINKTGLKNFELLFKLLVKLIERQVKKIFLYDFKMRFAVDEFAKDVVL